MDGPFWELLLVVVGGVFSLVLQVLAFGRPADNPTTPPLRLSELPGATPPPRKVATRVVIRQQTKKQEEGDGDEITLWLIGTLVGAIALAALYLEARQEIADGLRVLVLVGLGFWLATFVFLARQKAIVGYDWAVATALAAVVFLLAPAVVSALANPGYVTGRSYADLLKSYDSCGIGGVVDFDGLRGQAFVAAQMGGVVLYVIAWSAAATVLLVCLALNAVRLGARPRRLWTLLGRIPGPWRERPVLIIVLACIAAFVSLAFAGGAAQRGYASINASDDKPALSQVRVSSDKGRVRLVVRSDFSAQVTMRVRRADRTIRTVKRRARQGVNRWQFRVSGRQLPRKTYRIWLRARDASGASSELVSAPVPGRHPPPGC